MKKYLRIANLFLIFILSCIVSITIINDEKIKDTNNENIKLYIKNKSVIKENYIGYLKIDKINLMQGFYNINSKNNNLNKSIKLLKKEHDIIVLAGHSGNSNVSFFKNLYLLDVNDKIILNINHKNEEYYIDNIYKAVKGEKIPIYRDYNKKTLILITCDQKNKKYQNVYITYKI